MPRDVDCQAVWVEDIVGAVVWTRVVWRRDDGNASNLERLHLVGAKYRRRIAACRDAVTPTAFSAAKRLSLRPSRAAAEPTTVTVKPSGTVTISDALSSASAWAKDKRPSHPP